MVTIFCIENYLLSPIKQVFISYFLLGGTNNLPKECHQNESAHVIFIILSNITTHLTQNEWE